MGSVRDRAEELKLLFKSKGNLNSKELKKRREGLTNEIRKVQREESLFKRRNVCDIGSDTDEDDQEAPFDIINTVRRNDHVNLRGVLISSF